MSGYIGFRKVTTANDGSGIWTIAEQAKLKKDNIWPYNDIYFSSVSLLLHFDGANDSTTFTDSSSNNRTVTRYGNAKISTAQSKFGDSSGYFDGTTDYLDVNSAASPSGSESFTLEAWLYPTSNTGRDFVIFDARSTTGVAFFINSSSKLQVYDSGAGLLAASTASIPTNQWTHIAWVKNGSANTYYIGGTSSSGFTQSPIATATACRIGARNDTLAAFVGYMDEFRITKGVARYTGAFTAPTAPFPSN